MITMYNLYDYFENGNDSYEQNIEYMIYANELKTDKLRLEEVTYRC